MKLSAKGKVAITSLVDMAIHNTGKPIKLSEIATRQNVSLKFLEQIFFLLRKNGIVNSRRGPCGGYVFARDPSLVMIYDVIKAIEEELKINNFNNNKYLSFSASNNNFKCITHNLWSELNNHILNFLTSISIEDVKFNNFLNKMHENVEKISINN